MKAINYNGKVVHSNNRGVEVAYLGADGVAVTDGNGNIIEVFANQPSPTGLVDDAPHYVAARELAARLMAA
jgi:hypothetical protein